MEEDEENLAATIVNERSKESGDSSSKLVVKPTRMSINSEDRDKHAIIISQNSD